LFALLCSCTQLGCLDTFEMFLRVSRPRRTHLLCGVCSRRLLKPVHLVECQSDGIVPRYVVAAALGVARGWLLEQCGKRPCHGLRPAQTWVGSAHECHEEIFTRDALFVRQEPDHRVTGRLEQRELVRTVLVSLEKRSEPFDPRRRLVLRFALLGASSRVVSRHIAQLSLLVKY